MDKDRMKQITQSLLEEMGEDVRREGLRETPEESPICMLSSQRVT